MNKLTSKINALYFSTLFILMITLIVAWSLLFIPFIINSEQTKANLLLTPYAPIFEMYIDEQRFDDLDILISSLMLLKNDDSDQPLILSLKLKFNNKEIYQQNIQQTNSQFRNSIALFSPSNFEIMGSLEIVYNDYTYNLIKNNSNKIIAVLSIVCLIFLIVGHRLLSFFIRPLSILSQYLSNVETVNIDSLPQQNTKLSTEINNVWVATQILLKRIRIREDELKAKHAITEMAFNEKIIAIEANNAKSSFLANMSHEIRTPLTAIIGFADTLQNPNISESKRVSSTNTIIRNGKHLLSIINDILDISKIESGKLEIEQIDVSLLQIINEIEAVFSPLIEEKGLIFNIRYQFPLPKIIHSDPTRLRQVLFNLIGNANKFTKKGSITLIIEFIPDESIVRIRVKDTGIGLNLVQTESIFTPFSQADVSTTRKYGGTGLGLTISRRLAHMMGGDLSVFSEEGKGSEFVLTISTGPIGEIYSNISEFQTHYVDQKTTIDLGKLCGNVLIAEDTPDIQNLVSFYLSYTNISVTFANNGQEAVELIKRNEFDMVLMDMQMPVLDGIGATKQIRQLGFNKPIVALTANVMHEDQLRYKNSSLNDFVAKPIEKNELYRKLQKFLPQNYKQSNPTNDTGQGTQERDRNSEAEFARKAEKKRLTKQRLSRKFKERLPQWLSEIGEAIGNQDSQNLIRSAHVLKGLGGSFGYPEITEISKNIESMGKISNFDSANEYFDTLTQFCKKI